MTTFPLTGLSATHRILAALAALALLSAACSTGDDEFPPIDTTTQTTPTAETQTDTTLANTLATTATPPADDPEQAALQTWTALLNAARTGAPDTEQQATITALADPDTAQQLQTFFPESPGREITFHPKTTIQDDGTIAIDDCIIMNRGISTGASNWLIATATPTGPDNNWIITDLKLVNLDPCIPRSIATAAIQGYEAHLDAREVFYNPPDPDSPLLAETTSGEYLEFALDLIRQLDADGQRLIGRPKTDPHFWEIRSEAQVVILDCQEVSPDRGVYEIESGDRTDLIPPIEPGQLDLRQFTLVLEGDRWKVADVQGQPDSDCRTPPLPQTIQLAGG